MIESLTLGHTTCDYIEADEFYALADRWLHEHTLKHVVTLNPEMVMEAEHSADFRQAIEKADIRIPDGSGLIWARWYLRSAYWNFIPSLIGFLRRPAERITGVDAVFELSRLAHRAHKAVYLLGGAPGQADQTRELLQKQLPGIQVFVGPPHTFSMTGPQHIIDDITAKKPAVLFVAYGAPKQTQWIESNRAHLTDVAIAVGVGGAFAILSEDTPRAPKALHRLNLEWLWRLVLQPSRLPRIWQAVVQFPLLIQKQKREKRV